MDFSMKFFIFSICLYGGVTLAVKIVEKRRAKKAVEADNANELANKTNIED